MKAINSQNNLNRGGFVKVVATFMGSIIGAITGLPAISYLISPASNLQKMDAWIPVGLLESYQIGIPKLFKFTQTRLNGWEKTSNSYGVYVLRKSHNDLKVFSDICTHLGCKVTWHPDIQEYVSPCHDGHFDIDGFVTKGPPPRPLDQYEVKVEEGTIYVYLT